MLVQYRIPFFRKLELVQYNLVYVDNLVWCPPTTELNADLEPPHWVWIPHGGDGGGNCYGNGGHHDDDDGHHDGDGGGHHDDGGGGADVDNGGAGNADYHDADGAGQNSITFFTQV